MNRERLIATIVAVALFMEQVDSTIIATALPAIAADLNTSPLTLNVAVTAYLLALAIFIPISGWVADRFGARNVFRAAIVVFLIGSIACAMSVSLGTFVAARILQGMVVAMMTPVSRLILLRTVDKSGLVRAMSWLAVPGLAGPLFGPPLGGLIVTVATWHWIFLVNVPIGLLGIVMVTKYVPDIRVDRTARFDFRGFVLAGLGIGGIAFGLSLMRTSFLPLPLDAALVAAGVAMMTLYTLHARRIDNPVIDFRLLRLKSFQVAIFGGFLFRVSLGAIPFLLPLLFQLGFGMSPLQSGLLMVSTTIGVLAVKPMTPFLLKRLGFRKLLLINGPLVSFSFALMGLLTQSTPILVIAAFLIVNGFLRSLQFTAFSALGFADIEPDRMSQSTSFSSVVIQLSSSFGVALGAMSVEAAMAWHGHATATAADFPPAFVAIFIVTLTSVFICMTLPANAGEALANRAPSVPVAPPANDAPTDKPRKAG